MEVGVTLLRRDNLDSAPTLESAEAAGCVI